MPSDLLKKKSSLRKLVKGIRKAKQEKGRSHGGMSSCKVPVKVALACSFKVCLSISHTSELEVVNR